MPASGADAAAKERNRLDPDEDEDPDHAQHDRDPAEGDDAHRGAVDAFEPFDATRRRGHLPPHG